jgi:predicted nucleic acid-binding protein
MGLVIDSSALIAAERGALDLNPLLEAHGDEPAAIAAITASELLHGVHRLKGGVSRAQAEVFVEGLLRRLVVVPFDLPVARVHAMLAADLRSRGKAVGAHDLLIAATAVFLGYAVGTRDRRSFPRIPGLEILYW